PSAVAVEVVELRPRDGAGVGRLAAKVPVREVLVRGRDRDRVGALVWRGLRPAIPGHLADDVRSRAQVGEDVIAAGVGDPARLAVVQGAVAVQVQEDGPARQGRLARVAGAAVVDVGERGAPDAEGGEVEGHGDAARAGAGGGGAEAQAAAGEGR